MFLRKIFQTTEDAPSIYADLVIQTHGGVLHRLDVEQSGAMERARWLMDHAEWVGLALRWEKNVRVRYPVNGTAPEYFSRVVGRIGPFGHVQVRVACLRRGDSVTWLHRDGTVEVAPLPTV